MSIFSFSTPSEATADGTFYLGAYWLMWEDSQKTYSVEFLDEEKGISRGRGWMGIDLVRVGMGQLLRSENGIWCIHEGFMKWFVGEGIWTRDAAAKWIENCDAGVHEEKSRGIGGRDRGGRGRGRGRGRGGQGWGDACRIRF